MSEPKPDAVPSGELTDAELEAGVRPQLEGESAIEGEGEPRFEALDRVAEPGVVLSHVAEMGADGMPRMKRGFHGSPLVRVRNLLDGTERVVEESSLQLTEQESPGVDRGNGGGDGDVLKITELMSPGELSLLDNLSNGPKIPAEVVAQMQRAKERLQSIFPRFTLPIFGGKATRMFSISDILPPTLDYVDSHGKQYPIVQVVEVQGPGEAPRKEPVVIKIGLNDFLKLAKAYRDPS